MWVVGQKAHDELLEASAEVHTVDGFEVVVIASFADHVVVFVAEDLGPVGELALHYDEQKHSHGEDIDLRAFIDKLLEHFRCDVAWGAHSTRHLAQISRVTQAKIDQLEGQIAVNEDILEFKITMNDTCRRMKIFKGVKHLRQEEATCVLPKSMSTRVLNQIKHVQVVSSQVLSHKVNVSIFAVLDSLDMHDSVLAVSEHSQNIWMVKLRMIDNLLLDLCLVRSFDVRSRPQYFQHNILTTSIPVLRQIYLSVSTLINLLSDLIALVNHHCLTLGRSGIQGFLLLALIYTGLSMTLSLLLILWRLS